MHSLEGFMTRQHPFAQLRISSPKVNEVSEHKQEIYSCNRSYKAGGLRSQTQQISHVKSGAAIKAQIIEHFCVTLKAGQQLQLTVITNAPLTGTW